MSRQAVSAVCVLLMALGLAACSKAHSEDARLLTRAQPVPTTEAPAQVDAAADTAAPPTTNDVGPADPTPVLHPRPSSGGGQRASSGGGGGGTGRAVARPTAPRPSPFATAAPGATPKVWAVVIGIQQYQGRTHPTLGGEGDANAFMQALGNAHWPGDHIVELVDGQATAGNIRAAMQWLTQHSAPDTLTTFPYSGHVGISPTAPSTR